MEKEQIIKALECCIGDDDCNRCPYWVDVDVNCFDNVKSDALALIKELTIELDAMRGAANSYKMHNERLTEENETLKDSNEHLAVFLAEVKADTVREFTEKLKKECLVDSGYEVLQIGTIDHIAEEMLKSRECPQCKHFVGCEPSTLGVCDMYEEDEKE